MIMAAVLGVFLLSACQQSTEESGNQLSIEYEKYTLENGLEVVLHKDHSDPIVSLAILYHVGSNREKTGRTGFAHLFEHMLFQQSENVGQDQFFKKIQDVGGTLNGGTWRDGTIYFEIVPKNAMEKIMWLESDRMGYFINTVTESAFLNQQEVVQNEKRQRVDNNPYGHTSWVIDKNMYPEGHPYNWQVIGELEDLQNATIEDVKEFYFNFYGPNNATLVLAGDFDTEEAKVMIEKYFGEIKRGNEIETMEPMLATLNQTLKLYHEDNFARAAQLNMVWPVVEDYHPDAYALSFLAEILSEGKKAPLYKILVKERELTSSTRADNQTRELAGNFRIRITANSEVDLDDVEQGILDAFALFEKDGVTDRDVERVKAGLETGFYNNISSVLGKSFQLASYNTFAGEPNFIEEDISNILAVTKEDVMRVYEKYIKGKPYIATSFVPKGQVELIVDGSEMATVKEEELKANVEQMVADADEEIEKTPSVFDRTIEPEGGESPGLNIPTSWNSELANGMKVYGIKQAELPLVQFNMVLKGGHLLDQFEKIGVANLMTDIMMEGTKNKTPEELEEEIDLLGAEITMVTRNQSIQISANTLARNFDATLTLVEEMLLEPRWDEEEFDRIKTSTVNQIKRQDANPQVIARDTYNRALYGDDHMLGYNTLGTVEQVESITIGDLKEYYEKYFSPSITNFHVVGNITQESVIKALNSLETNWTAKDVVIPEFEIASQPDKASVYFVDVPQAKQSVIRAGYLALKRTDPDYYPSVVMNYKLGGSFSGNVNLILREEKGYTYGARSFFGGTDIIGAFTATSSVRTNVTLESVQIFKEEMEKYRDNGISEEDLTFTKNAMIKSNARRFETLNALLNMVQTMSAYDLPPDYIRQEEDIIRGMTQEQHQALAQKYIHPDKMVYTVAGDAETQFSRFLDAGFDEVKLVDRNAKEVEQPIKLEITR